MHKVFEKKYKNTHGINSFLFKKIASFLKGGSYKLEQFCATYEGRKLSFSPRAMGKALVLRMIKNELPDYADYITIRHTDSSYFASIAQVHHATINHNGCILDVAIKVQYPLMHDRLQKDMLLWEKMMTRMGSTRTLKYQKNVFNDIGVSLLKEADYINERRNLLFYHVFFKKKIILPKTIGRFCTSKILTMHWIKHDPLPLTISKDLAQEIFFFYFVPFLTHSVLHGDANQSNFGVSCDRLVVFDFGCVHFFNKKVRDGFLIIYKALLANDKKKIKEGLVLMGFYEDELKQTDAFDLLVASLRALFLPLTHAEFDFDIEHLHKLYESITRLQNIHIPSNIIFINRVLLCVYAILSRSEKEISWNILFQKLLNL